MDSAKCKICLRQFSNRKALGGHMRSHMAKLSIQPNNPPLNPDHTFSKFDDAYDDDEDQDQESETDTAKKRRRSKRTCRSSINRNKNRKIIESPDSSSVVSYVNEFSAEDAAQVLVLLSMEKWIMKKKKKEVADHHEQLEEDFTVVYRCETCNKGFQSYQALGGHRASHKKLRIDSDEEDAAAAAPTNNGSNQRTFKCPYCFKVFESGQAMGGHKKVHMSTTAAAASARRISTTDHDFIDLNLPAPEEDNASQVDDPSLK